MDFGFCSGSYTLQSPLVNASRCMNLYPETPESPSKSPITLMHTPGLSLPKYSLPETAVPCLFPVNGRGFAAAAQFYELFANGTFASRGVLNGPPLSPTQIFSCQTHLLILSNGSLYVYVLTAFTDSNNIAHSAGSFFAVDMSQFNGGAGSVLQIEFMDGYFFAAIANSNTFQVSNLEDGTTWNGLFISTVSYFPDNITSMKVDHRILWLYSGKKSVGYYNAGAGFPPFIPIEGAFLEDGAASTFATVSVNDTIAWISANERGTAVAKIMKGDAGERISTLAVEFAWQQYSPQDIANATAFAYQDQGHPFWQVRFGTKATWDYDFLTKLWHERGFWNAGTASYVAHRATSHMEIFGMHLVGDWKSGNIYEMSIDVYQDFGNPLIWERKAPPVSEDNKWIYHNAIEFDVQRGLGPMPPLTDGNGNPRGPQIELSWIDDLTKQSNTYMLDCGQAGQASNRARKTMLGRSRNRQYIARGSDPIPWRISNAFLDAKVGSS